MSRIVQFLLGVLASSFILQAGCFSQEAIERVRSLEEKHKFSDLNQLNKASETWNVTSKQDQAIQLWLKGLYLLYDSRHNEAYGVLFNAYGISKSTTDELLTAEISLDLAKVYSLVEFTGRSLSLLLEAEPIIIASRSDNLLGRFYIQLGELYRRMGYFDEALTSLTKAEDYIGENKPLRCSALNRRAAVYTEQTRHEEAKIFSREALRLAKELGDADLQAVSYNELAFLDKHTQQKDSVFLFYTRADSLWTSIGRLRYVAETRLALSIWYGVDSTMRDLSKSKEIAYSAFHLAKGKGWDYLEYDITKHISNLYNEMNRIDSSYAFSIMSHEAYLRYLEKRNDIETRILQAEYEQDKSKELIRDQRMKLMLEEEQNTAIRKQSTLYFFIMVISLLVIVLLSIILRMNQAKRKKALEIANNEARVRKSLEQNLEEKNVLLAEVNHRVKNNLQTMSSLIDLQRLSANSELVRDSLLESRRRIDAMGVIHEMLYANEFINKLDSQMYVKHLIESEKMIYEGLYENTEFVVNVESIYLGMNQCINLGMVISEFISNSFKHAFDGARSPKISILLSVQNGKVELSISDNGKGIREEELSKGESKSLGLKLIGIFSKKLSGEYFLKGDHHGTVLTVSFPV